MTPQEQRIAELEAMIELQKQQLAEKNGNGKLTLKVGPKGGISVYGTGRFPMTGYADTWQKLLDMKEEFVKFTKENAHLLAFKSDSPETTVKKQQARVALGIVEKKLG